MAKNNSELEIPPVLYKYRDLGNRYHTDLLIKQTLFFPKPSEFNDPFDGNIPIRWDKLTYNQCFQKNKEFFEMIPKFKGLPNLDDIVKQQMEEGPFWHPDRLKKETPEQIANWDSKIGLLSLSEKCDNILMWSHYANNHNGFVVGLNPEWFLTDERFQHIAPITYQAEYPLISGLDDYEVQFYKKFYTKSILWQYEKEWRISANHILNRKIQISKRAISEVIFGSRTSDKDILKWKRKIINVLGNDIDIFRATSNSELFKIDINPL